jgi:anti-sigma B factor antagonist
MGEMNLLVESSERGDWTVVDVKGEVDLYTVPKLKERLADLSSSGRHRVAVNLENVEFLDSTGLGVLIGGLKRAREAGGSLALVGPREHVRKVLTITGLDRVFPVHDSIDEAISE